MADSGLSMQSNAEALSILHFDKSNSFLSFAKVLEKVIEEKVIEDGEDVKEGDEVEEEEEYYEEDEEEVCIFNF